MEENKILSLEDIFYDGPDTVGIRLADKDNNRYFISLSHSDVQDMLMNLGWCMKEGMIRNPMR